MAVYRGIGESDRSRTGGTDGSAPGRPKRTAGGRPKDPGWSAYNDYKIKRLTYNDYLWGSLRFESQIKEIRRRAEWYETIELPPEVDPDTPIYVDEEAIRNSITGLF